MNSKSSNHFSVMNQAVVFFVFGCILLGVLGQQQCQSGRECMPIERCSEFESHIGQPYKTWPLLVQNEVKTLYCGLEEREGRKIPKVCCKPKTGLALLDLNKCGKNNWSRLTNGRIATLFEYPWITLLGGSSGAFHCTGSLISESFVITAAHCNEVLIQFVRLGEIDQSTSIDCHRFSDEVICAEPHQDIPVERVIQHLNYNKSSKKNDIALLKLVRPAKLNDNVLPICLPLPQMTLQKFPTTMRIAGWGHSRMSTEISSTIRFAQVPIIEQQQCNHALSLLRGNLTVDESEVCTGAADNCPVDSGGALQYSAQNQIVIYGVASCGEEKVPDVYISVPYFMDWIIENLK